jgi:16S rRNA (cytosine1402-N4)-methyltransferase
MAAEVVAALAPKAGAIIVDGTFGGGGYSAALLAAADCRVIGIDRDPRAVAGAADMRKNFGDRLVLIEGRFADMESLLAARGVNAVNGVAFDLGLSSLQLDDPARGFSFQGDGPLDMRMGAGAVTAADLVNDLSEADLTDTLRRLGEEPRAKAIARAILRQRLQGRITRTSELAAIVARAARGAPGHHPATRTFQALRMRVNDELGELADGLAAAERVMAPKGRLAVVAFHSLEDRLVKRFLVRRGGRRPGASRHQPPLPAQTRAPSWQLLFSGVMKPSAAEIAANPRARSARLRAAERTAAPPWPADGEAAA